MKGHVVAVADPTEFVDAYELSFPSPLGMSGAPVWCHYVDEASGEKYKGIAGVLFGSRESSIEVFKHEARDANGHVERERVLRVVELGLARRASRMVTFLKGVDPGPEELDFTYFPE
jgi:hypothetical protein